VDVRRFGFQCLLKDGCGEVRSHQISIADSGLGINNRPRMPFGGCCLTDFY
jgi:hypothetical protein